MIDELIERVRGLVGPDREVDARIRCLLLAGEGAYVEKSPFNGEWCVYRPDRPGRARSLMEPQWVGVKYELWKAEYTASLDAAVALVERVLGEDAALEILAEVAEAAARDTVNGSVGDLPRRVILALLIALKTKEARDGR